MPMGVTAEHYPTFLKSPFTLTNICGALITMPHKVTTTALCCADAARPVDQVAPRCADRRAERHPQRGHRRCVLLQRRRAAGRAARAPSAQASTATRGVATT